MSHVNPFEGKSLEEIHSILTSTEDTGLPKWPNTKLQAGYTGTHSVDLLRRAFSFVQILADDNAFVPNWKGLDYGCGWGRFASVCLTKGSPDQLDLVDAWFKTISIIETLGYKNKISHIPELLEEDSLPKDTYDMGLSFSVFTHLSPLAISQNLPVLVKSMKVGGKFYFTVRHDEFINHKYPQRHDEITKTLNSDNIAFLDSGGDLGSKKAFGDTILKPVYLENIIGDTGELRYMGQPHSLQHVYCVTRKK